MRPLPGRHRAVRAAYVSAYLAPGSPKWATIRWMTTGSSVVAIRCIRPAQRFNALQIA
jgi:hypothetical protein